VDLPAISSRRHTADRSVVRRSSTKLCAATPLLGVHHHCTLRRALHDDHVYWHHQLLAAAPIPIRGLHAEQKQINGMNAKQ
jgi:hypothetical protein